MPAEVAEIEEAIKQFEGLIKWTANKYKSKSLPFDDLVQEGFCTLTVCWNKGFRGEDFVKVFKTALMNRIKDLCRMAYSKGRTGVVISLDEISVEDRSRMDDILFEESLSHMMQLLTPLQTSILSELLDPSDKVLIEAEKERLRKKKLYSQGKKVRGYKKPIIKETHIMTALGIHGRAYRYNLLELQKKATHSFVS